MILRNSQCTEGGVDTLVNSGGSKRRGGSIAGIIGLRLWYLNIGKIVLRSEWELKKWLKAGIPGGCNIEVKSLVMRVRQRKWSGGMLASAHRLSAELLRNAPVAIRGAKVWVVSSNRSSDDEAWRHIEAIIKYGSDQRLIEPNTKFAIAPILCVE